MATAGSAKINEPWNVVVNKRAATEVDLPIYLLERQIITKEASVLNPIKDFEVYHLLITRSHIR